MKNKFLIPVFLMLTLACFGQKDITWEDLSKVTFAVKHFPSEGADFLAPTFSNSVKALDGQKVTITGYFLNISPAENLFILSKNPIASCFFCGNGGPETAIELHFGKKQVFKTDDIVAITGTIELNADKIDHFNYIIKDCQGELID